MKFPPSRKEWKRVLRHLREYEEWTKIVLPEMERRIAFLETCTAENAERIAQNERDMKAITNMWMKP